MTPFGLSITETFLLYCKEGEFDIETDAVTNHVFSINLNIQHVNGLTLLDLYIMKNCIAYGLQRRTISCLITNIMENSVSYGL